MPALIPSFGRNFIRCFAAFWVLTVIWCNGWAQTTSTAHAPPVQKIRTASEWALLKVGASSDSFPYSYIGADGKLTGFAVDLLDAVARTMQFKVERIVLPGQELQKQFMQGEYDMMQLLSQTEQRQDFADFSVPLLTLQGAIFIHKDDASIRSLNDLNGRKFAILGTNSIGEKFLQDHGLKVEPFYVSSTYEGLRLVESGKCAAIFVSQLTALSVMERDGLHRTRIFQQPFANYDIRHCFPVHKGDAQLLARLNEGLAILHRTGEFDRIYHHWFGRLTSPLISRQQVIYYAIGALGIALLAALGALWHQRTLRRRITRQAEELARQQNLLRTLYDNIPLAMCVLEATTAGDYLILSVNRQAEPYFGSSVEQLTGRYLLDLTLPSEWTTHLAELLKRGVNVRKFIREERNLTISRKRLIFTLVPMSPSPAQNARLCVLAEDVTDRRNLDEEIAQSRKLRALGELVGGIAHEFNNLLTPIMLKVGQIEHDWSHDHALMKETRLISEAVHRSSELTRRLLTFGRKSDHRLEQLYVANVVSNCFSLLKLTMDRRIQWEQNVPADLPPIVFSNTDLNQIILNLVINARDALMEKLSSTPSGWTPVIRIEATLLPPEGASHADDAQTHRLIRGWQRLTIRDNGAGIPPAVKERIFEPFFTTKDIGQGTGLGLATVWHLVTAASGRIELESTVGEGTAFHILLPILSLPANVPEAVAHPVNPPQGPARIFLADDDALVASAVIATLRRAGHSVTHLPDGAAAWNHLKNHFEAFDLLILDVNMPGLDGIKLAEHVRASGQYKGRIIIASGRLTSDDLESISEAQIDCVLNKPFDTAELLNAVNKYTISPAGP